MWDLPRPGLKPVSPALAGRVSTTAPPGRSQTLKVIGPTYTVLTLKINVRKSNKANFSQDDHLDQVFHISNVEFFLKHFRYCAREQLNLPT